MHDGACSHSELPMKSCRRQAENSWRAEPADSRSIKSDYRMMEYQPSASEFEGCGISYLSMQIFSTWGTRTCSSRMMVWRGSFAFHDNTWDTQEASWRRFMCAFQHRNRLTDKKKYIITKDKNLYPFLISAPGCWWWHTGQATPCCLWLCVVTLTTGWNMNNHLNCRNSEKNNNSKPEWEHQWCGASVTSWSLSELDSVSLAPAPAPPSAVVCGESECGTATMVPSTLTCAFSVILSMPEDVRHRRNPHHRVCNDWTFTE